MIRAILRDQRGGPAPEFALMVFLMVMISMAIVDFGRATWQWSAAQKATQVGARIAVVRDPLYLPIKYHFDCNPPPTNLLGELCLDPATNVIRPECDFAPVVCTNTGCNGQAYDTAQATSFAQIVEAMQIAYPMLTEDQVSIAYTPTELGFLGKPAGPIAEVTAEITGGTFEFLGLVPLWGTTTIDMRPFRTTFTSEDFSDNSLEEQGLATGGGGGGGGGSTPVCA